MTKEEGVMLFKSMHPNFFEQADIINLPDDWVFDEMVLPLDKFDPLKYDRRLSGVSFGYYRGDIAEIKKAAEKVDPNWPQYFNESQRIYCGYTEGKTASFCTITDLGAHKINGREVRVGGPGCVGTIPEYRRRGIGLTMVKHVTLILKNEGYDYSYIHYTSEAAWYKKLGYEALIQWTGKGIL